MFRPRGAAVWPWLLLVCLLSLWAMAGCAGPSRPANPPPPTPDPGSEPGTPPVEPERLEWSIAQWLDYLTVEEKVGQLFWVGLPDQGISQEAQALLRQGQVGGFVLFSRQGGPAQLRLLTDSLQALATERERRTPGLMISADQEGGLVQRFRAPFTEWPGAMALGAAASETQAEQVAAAIARELRTIGVNLNLAPVADVNSNPYNPVIGIRSFGADPTAVAALVRATVRGLQAEGVSAAAKHFPGHGDTERDSHFTLPIVGHSLERLKQVELPPFYAAIAAGTDVIMAAHVIFPAADDQLPATLSPVLLTGLLKEQMGFEGVVVTDAMEMKAIADHWGVGAGLIRAIAAGADAVLVGDSFGKQQEYYAGVLQAVQSGVIPLSRLDDAVRRNLALKQKHGLLEEPYRAAAGPMLGADLTEAHAELARQVGSDALTLVRNQQLPLALTPDKRVLVIGPTGAAAAVTGVESIATALGAGIRSVHANTREMVLGLHPDDSVAAAVRSAAREAAAIIYGVNNGHTSREHQALIRSLIAGGTPVVVIGLGEPYELTVIPEIQTYVAAYGSQRPNLYGVGPMLFGKTTPRGRLPVTLPGLYPIGHGLAF